MTTDGAAFGRDHRALQLSRRRFLIAAAATAALPPRAWSAPVTAGAPTAPVAVVIDRTLPHAEAFAAAAAARGARVLPFAGDPARLWMETLEPALRNAPLSIAALTSGGSHFALELLARSYGLRTVLRIEHAPAGAGFVHHVAAAGEEPELAERLAGARGAWPALVAASLLDRAAAPHQPRRVLDLLQVAAPRGSPPSYSWLLAPRS